MHVWSPYPAWYHAAYLLPLVPVMVAAAALARLARDDRSAAEPGAPRRQDLRERAQLDLLRREARCGRDPRLDGARVQRAEEVVQQALAGGRVVEDVADQRGLRRLVDEVPQPIRGRREALEEEGVAGRRSAPGAAPGADPSPGRSRPPASGGCGGATSCQAPWTAARFSSRLRRRSARRPRCGPDRHARWSRRRRGRCRCRA